jgi:hypothetical protein
MEHFCEPTTRRYRGNEQDDDDDGTFDEVQLSVPVEDFLVYRWDWKELRTFLIGGVTPKLLWITGSAFLVVDEHYMSSFDHQIYISANIMQATSHEEHALFLVLMAPEDKITAEVGVFWRAVATSNSVQLTINDGLGVRGTGTPSGPLLSQFLRESPSLKFLDFDKFHFEEEHCRALASLQRTDLKISLSHCKLDPQDAEDTFIEWFRHNQVVTELNCCVMGSRIISALSGNNSVKSLKVESCFFEKEMRFLLQALPGNMGIEHLTVIVDDERSDEFWCLLFHSLSTHPRIECVAHEDDHRLMGDLSAESKTTMMNAILQMLRHNTVVRTIALPRAFVNEEVYQNTILPRLERNRNCFEVQRRALKRADPAIRSQLLGRALHVVRYNPNLVFRFLSENVPAFVRTEEEEEDSVIPLHQNEAATIVSGQKRKTLE